MTTLLLLLALSKQPANHQTTPDLCYAQGQAVKCMQMRVPVAPVPRQKPPRGDRWR
jgi:hypothetical protein